MVFAAARRLIGSTYRKFALDPEVAADAQIAAADFLGRKDGIFSGWTDLSVEASDFGQKIIYPEESTPHPDYSKPLIADVIGYSKVKRIDIKKAERMQGVLEMQRILKQKARGPMIGGFCFGPLGVLGMMRGTEHLFRDCLRYPDKVKTGLDIISDVLAEYVAAQCDNGACMITLDTLYASWAGLSKRLWEEIEGPFVKKLSGIIRSKGRMVGVHNCGQGAYFDSQIKYMKPDNISFAYLPDDCSSPSELKRKYGHKVTLTGYVSTALLMHGTPFDVTRECNRIIKELAHGGNFVLAPQCEFPPDAPLENAIAMVKAARYCPETLSD